MPSNKRTLAQAMVRSVHREIELRRSPHMTWCGVRSA
jgi:hypothetical protein